MENSNEVITVAHAIAQSVAPVFLLAGVGGILNVLSGRLGRVIDRYRKLDELNDGLRAAYLLEMKTLLRRSTWIHWSISLSTICALLVCIVIAALFIGSELNKDPSALIASFFIGAMLALTLGLLCFLREIALATGAIKPR